MALERDKVYENVDTRFIRPVNPDLGQARELGMRALGNIAEAGIESVKEGTVKAATDQADATIRAYDRMQRLDENASNFEDVFAGADNETVRAGRDMLGQLKREAGSLAAAVSQGKVNSSVAQARLERIVMDKAQMFPGWENDIASAVSGHLKFDPRGFAARRILGLDQQDKSGEKSIVEKARDQAIMDVTKSATAVAGASVINNAAEAYRDDAGAFISAIEPFAELQQKATRASLLFEASKNDKANSDIHARTLITTASQTLVANLNTQVGVHLKRIRNLHPTADNAREIATSLEDARQYIIQLGANYDNMMLGQLKTMTPDNPAIAPELLDRDSWVTERESFKEQVAAALNLLNPSAINTNQESAMSYLSLLKRADFFTRAPITYKAASVFGTTALGMAFNNSPVWASAARESTSVLGGAPAYGQKPVSQGAMDAVTDVLGGDVPVANAVRANSDPEKLLTGLDEGISAIFDTYASGTDKPTNEVEAYRRALDIYKVGVNEARKDGKTSLRADVFQNQRLFDTLTSDGVLKNASPEGRKYLVSNMRTESARAKTQLFAWFDGGGEGSFAYTIADGKTVYINGQPSNLREVMVSGTTPNPSLFVLENGGTTVRPRKLQDVPKPGDMATNPDSRNRYADAVRKQAESQEAIQRWAQAYNAQMPWLKKLDARINKFSGQ